MKDNSVILTGMQPSGSMHIGNYFCVLKYFLSLTKQKKAENCIFMIADIHSLNILPEPSQLNNNIIQFTSSLLACGLGNGCTLFCQSYVSFHSELATILSTIANIGRLERMTQFKDKSSRGSKEGENLGLLAYPVLQASDILLYQATDIPVGPDQVQHLELSRHIAERFNRIYNSDVFTIPKALINADVGKITSLSDGSKKMSKSDPNQDSCIYLTDTPDDIKRKIKKAKTDSTVGISYSESRPEVSNLIRILANCIDKKPADVANEYASYSNSEFKNVVTDALISVIDPIRKKISVYSQDKGELVDRLRLGRERAENISSVTMKKVRETVGLLEL